MSLKQPRGFFGNNKPIDKENGAEIQPIDSMGLEDDGLLEIWIAKRRR